MKHTQKPIIVNFSFLFENILHRIFTRTGTQGNKWQVRQVNIRGVRQIFNIEVEAIRGISYAGDISLDDFTLTNGPCNTPAHCDFENSQCYFSNYNKYSKMDKFDWTLSNDGTPSLGTGPRTDHTTGTNLGMMFLNYNFLRDFLAMFTQN